MSDKKCARCYLYKSYSEFGSNRKTKDKKNCYCILCARELRKISHSKPENKKASNLRSAEYYQKNRHKRNEYQRLRHHIRKNSDPAYILKRRYRCRIRKLFRYKNFLKKTSAIKLLGCTQQEFINYFESKFTQNMTWEKVYAGEIHIDHIIPISSANTEQDLIRLSHFTNLQPLWAKDNLKKSDKL